MLFYLLKVPPGVAYSFPYLKICNLIKTKLQTATEELIKYQGVKNFTLVARMQNSNSILRQANDESSVF